MENIHGKKVAPEMAVSPDWKGRNILVVGKSRYPAETLKKPLIDKLDNLILPVTHKPSSMERDMLVHEEVLELSQDLQPETVLFNQIEIRCVPCSGCLGPDIPKKLIFCVSFDLESCTISMMCSD